LGIGRSTAQRRGVECGPDCGIALNAAVATGLWPVKTFELLPRGRRTARGYNIPGRRLSQS